MKITTTLMSFTSHYVTINSLFSAYSSNFSSFFTSHYVTINSCKQYDVPYALVFFTSHYVTINSEHNDHIAAVFVPLHPTM